MTVQKGMYPQSSSCPRVVCGCEQFVSPSSARHGQTGAANLSLRTFPGGYPIFAFFLATPPLAPGKRHLQGQGRPRERRAQVHLSKIGRDLFTPFQGSFTTSPMNPRPPSDERQPRFELADFGSQLACSFVSEVIVSVGIAGREFVSNRNKSSND